MFQWTNTPDFRSRQLSADEFHRQVIAMADTQAALRAGSPPAAVASSRNRSGSPSALVRIGGMVLGKTAPGSLT